MYNSIVEAPEDSIFGVVFFFDGVVVWMGRDFENHFSREPIN